MNILKLDSYKETLQNIKEKIYRAQYNAIKAVNTELITLYWDLGKTIFEKQRTEHWGTSTVETLAKDLQIEFSGVKGWSSSNLWRMKKFYETYKDNEKLAPLVREISWSHNLIIMEKCKNNQEREFYIKMSQKIGWSKYTLIDKIKMHEYERYLNNQTNFNRTVDVNLKEEILWETKDDYNLDFILTENPHAEKELEQAIMENISKFLAEMGGNYAFLGRQFRVEFEEKEYFIDLLFYNRILNCLVALELKAVEFTPEHLGKMQFYLIALNKTVRAKTDNASIGIIICKNKNRTVVEYMLKNINQPIGVSTYNHYSTLDEVPGKIAKYLPSKEAIEKRLAGLFP